MDFATYDQSDVGGGESCLLTPALCEVSLSLPMPLPFDVETLTLAADSALPTFEGDALACLLTACGAAAAATAVAVQAASSELYALTLASPPATPSPPPHEVLSPAYTTSPLPVSAIKQAKAALTTLIRSPHPYRIPTHHHHHYPQQRSAVVRPSSHVAPDDPRRCSFFNLRCGCLFSRIPDDVLTDCFQFLDVKMLCAISSVSSRWRYLTSDQQLWKSLDLSLYAEGFDDRMLLGLKPRFGDALESLKLCHCIVSSEALFDVLSDLRLPALLEFHLCQLPAVTDAAVINFLTLNGRSLQSLSLFGCTKLTNASVQQIGTLCPVLGELSVRGCTKITADAFRPLPPANNNGLMNASGALSASLHSLNLSSCRNVNGSDALSHITAFTDASRGQFQLKRLNLHGLNSVSDRAVIGLARAQPTLSSLHLSSSNPFGGSSLLTDSALVEGIARYCTRLKFLDLQGANNLTDAGLIALVTVGMHATPIITSAGGEAGGGALTTTSAAAVTTTGSGQFLTRLNLGGCDRLTDAAIMKLVAHCPNLTQLSLFHCTKLTDASVMAIASGAVPRLQQLDLHSCAGLTPQSIALIRRALTPVSAASVTMRRVASATRMSRTLSFDEKDEAAADAAIAAAAVVASTGGASAGGSAMIESGGLIELRQLDVGACSQLTAECISSLAQAHPKVQLNFN